MTDEEKAKKSELILKMTLAVGLIVNDPNAPDEAWLAASAALLAFVLKYPESLVPATNTGGIAFYADFCDRLNKRNAQTAANKNPQPQVNKNAN